MTEVIAGSFQVSAAMNVATLGVTQVSEHQFQCDFLGTEAVPQYWGKFRETTRWSAYLAQKELFARPDRDCARKGAFSLVRLEIPLSHNR